MRYGKIEVSEEVLVSFWSNIQGQFIPLEVSYDYCRKVFIYTGKSLFFQDIKEGSIIPLYSFTFERVNDNYIIIKGVTKHE